MKNAVFFSLFVIANLAGTNSLFSQNANTLFSLKVVGIEAGEWFSFKDNLGRETSTNHSGTFNLGGFSQGSRYEIFQKNGSRNCKLIYNEGTVTNTPIIVVANCSREAPIPITIFSLKTTGIEVGEWFTFKDNLGRETSVNHSTTSNLGGFTQGSQYNITQTKGSRNCKLSLNEGTVTSNVVTVLADCSKTSVTPSNPSNPTTNNNEANQKTFDLVSRSEDKKTFGILAESGTPAIGGVVATGVTEGQFVAYMTSAKVDPNHDGKFRQIMWFNRNNGKSALVSSGSDGKGGDKDSFNPVINYNGYTVAFESFATNLVQGDTNRVSDVFYWNLLNSTVKCVTCHGNYPSDSPTISGDGNWIAFQSSANNLTSGVEGNSTFNVYLANLNSGEIILLSKDPKTGKGVGGSHPSVSEDGSRVAFYSYSDKLVEGDANKLWDIFVWERGNPNLRRVSLTSDGMERDQGDESATRVVKPTISGNGKFVTFATTATNMSGSPTNKQQHIYVAEVDTGRLIRASKNAEGVPGNGNSPISQGERIPISHDGYWITFTTDATNLGGKLVVKNIIGGETHSVQTTGRIGTPTISRDGKCIAFPAGDKLDTRFNSSGIFASCLKP